MTTLLSPLPVQRFYDNNNVPLVGGLLYTYIAGTSTPCPTYTDSTGATANTNPIVLNSRGEANVWLTPRQAYKFVLQDATFNTIWTVDQINAIFVSPLAQCRLTLKSGNLVLSPYQGNFLTINGSATAIPSAGVSLAPAGLAPGTTYYIYAYMNSGTMTLEASTTVYATDANTGVTIKTGDPTRSLVGMALPTTGPAWVDTEALRYVLSWYNRRNIYCTGTWPTNNVGGQNQSSFVELNGVGRAGFLCWGDSDTLLSLYATFFTALGTMNATTALAIDSATVPIVSGQVVNSNSPNLSTTSMSKGQRLTEGAHFATLLYQAANGTTGTTYNGGNVGTNVTALIQG